MVIWDSPKYYLALLKKASKATGRLYVDEAVDELLVKDVESIGNFVRITAILPNDTPTDEAGFAYLLNVGDGELRYYTLKKAWQENGQIIGHIDVFTHNDTMGSVWAKSIKIGDRPVSNRRYLEKTDHLKGQVLLIGDETSLPTIIRLLQLQHFDNPIVIACLHEKNDECYLKDCTSDYHVLDYDEPMDLLQKINDFLDKQCPKIDSVWTAMESQLIKELRVSLKQKLQLSKDAMTIKVYWRMDK